MHQSSALHVLTHVLQPGTGFPGLHKLDVLFTLYFGSSIAPRALDRDRLSCRALKNTLHMNQPLQYYVYVVDNGPVFYPFHSFLALLSQYL